MQPPIILDIEASGFGVGSYPIEIGYASANGETWCALVQPQAEWLHWDIEAEKLHQQSRQHLMQHGIPAWQIAKHLNLTFSGQTLYSDAWFNDFVWLSCLYEAANMQPSFKLEDLRVILSPQQADIWHPTKQAIMASLTMERHRASIDAKVLQLTWMETVQPRVSVPA